MPEPFDADHFGYDLLLRDLLQHLKPRMATLEIDRVVAGDERRYSLRIELRPPEDDRPTLVSGRE